MRSCSKMAVRLRFRRPYPRLDTCRLRSRRQSSRRSRLAPRPTCRWVSLFAARSGDKGGNANVGIWARDRIGYTWLHSFLTADKLRELMPETAGLVIRRYELPNLNALNFVVVGLLGDGVASSTRFDPQAKSLGEFLRSRVVPLPKSLLEEEFSA